MTSPRPNRQRRAIVAGAILALVLAAVGAYLLLQDGNDPGTSKLIAGAPAVVDAGRPHPGGDPFADLVLPPEDQLFGFSAGSALVPPASLSREFDIGATPERAAADVVAGGGTVLRHVVGWIEAEPEQGRLDEQYLAYIDGMVAALRRVGVRPLFVLDSIPAWAQAEPGDPRSGVRAGPRIDAAYGRFAALVARRWPQAAGIETINEPNVGATELPGRSPERFAALHRAAAEAIRGVAPEMPVIVGGLSGTDGSAKGTMRVQEFLKRAYAAGLRPGDYDAVGIHPYPGQRDGRMGTLAEGGTFAAALADFRAGFRWIDPDARVWVTEVGLSTSGRAPLSPRRQARDLVALVRQLSSMIDVDAVFVHTLYDLPAKPRSDGERGFGVLIPHRTGPNEPKPAFCALRALAPAAPALAGC